MKLNLEQISTIARGAARISYVDEKICLFRFTKEQEDLYEVSNADFYKKTFATAGVILEFMTDSSTLSLEVEVFSGSSRKFFAHSIYVNGNKYATLNCLCDNNGIFGGKWTFPEGEKKVKIYFPWSTASRIIDMSLDDGATLIPVRKQKKMIMFGDSITHGYDAMSPENSYAARLADALDVEAINKGIGGEVFRGKLSEFKDSIEPDYITVAYGTNDWSVGNRERFETHCKAFYENLSKNYPNSKIFAITPIWRNEYATGKITDIGTLDRVEEYIREVTAALPNVTVIKGLDLVPPSADFFAPDIIHPNDKGFEHYFENLVAEIKKHID